MSEKPYITQIRTEDGKDYLAFIYLEQEKIVYSKGTHLNLPESF